jgi:amphi-Trp domain-containing protein
LNESDTLTLVGGRYRAADDFPGDPAMARRRPRPERDIVKDYPRRQVVAKLRRLADCLESGTPFRIQVAGERITVPPHAVANLEHERGEDSEELEFQLVWTLARD